MSDNYQPEPDPPMPFGHWAIAFAVYATAIAFVVFVCPRLLSWVLVVTGAAR